jgi:hypothetical protein
MGDEKLADSKNSEPSKIGRLTIDDNRVILASGGMGLASSDPVSNVLENESFTVSDDCIYQSLWLFPPRLLACLTKASTP